jgi:hypothetical protein
MNTPMFPSPVPPTVHSLLRGEIAAVETYDRVIGSFAQQPLTTELTRIRDDHQRAVVALRDRAECGSAEAFGAWGEFGTAATGAAEQLGAAAVLAALRQGEEHEAGEYETALADPTVAAECKDLIRSDLLPRCRAHVTDLDHLLAGAR